MKALIAIPAFNEERNLARAVERYHSELEREWGENWEIVIAENGSTDATARIARELSARLPRVRTISLPVAGKGGAIRAAWQSGPADVYAFVDADDSVHERGVVEVIRAVDAGSSIALGSRYAKNAQSKRSWNRAFFSHAYGACMRTLFGDITSDPQCGCKAVSARVVDGILSHVRDDKWFFDTELIVHCRRAGLASVDVPIAWKENLRSNLKPGRVGWYAFRKLIALRIRL